MKNKYTEWNINNKTDDEIRAEHEKIDDVINVHRREIHCELSNRTVNLLQEVACVLTRGGDSEYAFKAIIDLFKSIHSKVDLFVLLDLEPARDSDLDLVETLNKYKENE